MKRCLVPFAVVGLLCVLAPSASAQYPVGAAPIYAGPIDSGCADCGYPIQGGGFFSGMRNADPNSAYGWNPVFRKISMWCKGAGPIGYAPAPVGVQGTLVFPNHPFARSPRDFFMMD